MSAGSPRLKEISFRLLGRMGDHTLVCEGAKGRLLSTLQSKEDIIYYNNSDVLITERKYIWALCMYTVIQGCRVDSLVARSVPQRERPSDCV